MNTLIQTHTDLEELVYTPGDQPATFNVLTANFSDQFASFQVNLEAAGQNSESENDWYAISPEISTKNPPGATTSFQVSIIENPIPGFVGFMNLTIRIYSIELKTESREVIKLNVTQGKSALPIDLELPIAHFQSNPEIQFDIPIFVSNPNQWQTTAFVQCLGLKSEWLVDQKEQVVPLAPGEQKQIVLTYQLPEPVFAPSKRYDFHIEASHAEGIKARVSGTLEIVPEGTVDLKCDPSIQSIPPKLSHSHHRSEDFTFELELINDSNVPQSATLDVTPSKSFVKHLELESTPIPVGIGESTFVALEGQVKRPWLGRMKIVDLQVDLQWSNDHKLTVHHEASVLTLKVKPMFPWWFVMIFMGLVGFLSWRLSPWNTHNDWWGHQESVTSVQLNGLADQAISASNDRTAIRWNVSGLKNWWDYPYLSEIVHNKAGNESRKAIRVTRYRPVNNDWVALGLENGVVQVWDLKKEKMSLLQSFAIDEDDRVFDVQFTNDSEYLLSSHGSGKVRVWPILSDRPGELWGTREPLKQMQLNFAISASAWVDRRHSTLAIAGRFNQISLWNWRGNSKPTPIKYPRPGGKDDYIQSVSTAALRPNRMVTADTQGHITLWELQDCQGKPDCNPATILDDWGDGHGGQPIRSVSISEDGCFLASGGDDGRVMLWPLSANGRLPPQKGVQLFDGNSGMMPSFRYFIRSNAFHINSVDIKESNNQIFVLSGSTDTQVRLHQESLNPLEFSDSTEYCRTLKRPAS